MFPSRKYNSEINNSHEKCLRLIDSEKISSHKESLEKDGSISIRYVNIQDLVVEICKESMIPCGTNFLQFSESDILS